MSKKILAPLDLSAIPTGTAPLVVASTTVVTNLNADLLDGQHGSYYAAASSLSNYLPLTGGTLTGVTRITGQALAFIRGGTDARLTFEQSDGVRRGLIAVNPTTQVGSFVVYAADGGTPLGQLNVGSGGLTYDGKAVWHSGNDGAGSGLDADLLDGQHGSYYAADSTVLHRDGAENISGPKTFTYGVGGSEGGEFGIAKPASGTSLTSNITVDVNGDSVRLFAGNATGGGVGVFNINLGAINGSATAWHSLNDGAGSGLDADLLDGQHGSYYARAAVAGVNSSLSSVDTRTFANATTDFTASGLYQDFKTTANSGAPGNFFAHVQTISLWADDSGGGVHQLIYSDNGNLYRRYGTRAGGWGTTRTVWDSGNHGAGSGLDADLLDGQQSSYYTNIPARLGYTPVNKAGDVMAGVLSFPASNTGMAIATGGLAAAEVLSTGTGAAFASFHRPGAFAAYFGIDTDNKWKVGGWSMGANAYEIWHAGTFDPAGKVNKSGDTMTGDLATAGAISDSIGNVRDIPVVTRNSTTAFSAADRGKAIVKDNTTAYTWGVNTGVFVKDMAITVINDSTAGDVTIGQGAGMTLISGTTTGNFTLAPGQSRTLLALSSTRVRIL